MKLNVDKCSLINFSLKRTHNIVCDYYLNNFILQYVPSLKDLGVVFTHNMSFSLHINAIVKKSLRMLGFVRRTMKECNDVNVYKVLYNAHVRSHLDYCSSIWSPKSKSLVSKLEGVQKRFVKRLCFHAKIKFDSSEYVKLCAHFNLTTLEFRRRTTDLLLFHKILHGQINCPYLLSAVHFHLPPRRTRHTCVFTCSKKCRLCVRSNDFLPRTISLVNSSTSLDVFNSNISLFKRDIMKM